MCHDVASRPICHVVERGKEGRSLSKGCGTTLTHRERSGEWLGNQEEPLLCARTDNSLLVHLLRLEVSPDLVAGAAAVDLLLPPVADGGVVGLGKLLQDVGLLRLVARELRLQDFDEVISIVPGHNVAETCPLQSRTIILRENRIDGQCCRAIKVAEP